MKETKFIEENKKKWNRFEELYESKSNDPEELSDLYMDITDDLSYAQTFYKRRTVRVYLNQLAQKVYTGVHKQKGESLKKFITVWQISLPLEIYRSRKNLLFALVAFLIYAAIGAFTTYVDPEFPRDVLGDGYVDMTIQNIQNGNPLAVYEDENQTAMFIQITTNNLKVAFLTFFVGFFFTLGTHMLLFYNGVMLGSFQYFFHVKGLLITSFLGIWIHGAFEISAIVLAGGAGITAGNGLLFPKSYTRLQSLQLSTKRGLKIMLSLVPFIIAAGFLESFVTANYQDLPNWSKWAIIMFSFAIILFVYVFYPIHVARKYPELVDKEDVGNFHKNKKFDFYKIRNVGEVVADSFRMYRLQFSKFAKINTRITLPLILLIVYLQDINHYNLQQTEYWYDWAAQLEFIMGYSFLNVQDFIVFGLWTFITAFVFTSVIWCVHSIDEKFSWSSFFQFVKQRFFGIWLGNLLLCLIMLIFQGVFAMWINWFFFVPALFLIPLPFLIAVSMGLGTGSIGSRFREGFKYSTQHYWKSILLVCILFLIVFILVQPIALYFSIHDTWTGEPMMSDALDVVSDFVKRIAQLFTGDYMIWSNAFRQLVYVIVLLGVMPLVVITMAFGYFTGREKVDAAGLRKQYEKFGKRSRIKETPVDFD
ncbi:MAG: stage II sporulation protein M [Crocinitomicaceae bacterium]|nr:stage II sporulation protein M [Crocinitomicaceae bacterium]